MSRAVALPDWGPGDLAAALAAQGPVAVLGGLNEGGRRCTLVAWDLGAPVASLEEAVGAAQGGALGEVGAEGGAPVLLGALVGSLAWDGSARFCRPGSAALFDPGAGRLWVRGELPAVVAALPPSPEPPVSRAVPAWTKDGYCAAVREAQARMAAGEIEKVILSVAFAAPCSLPPVAVFERLAAGAETGLPFLLPDGEGGYLIGHSPEPLVLLAERRAQIHLLAGTRKAGAGLEADLLANPKDRREHMVAVEQARRDLSAVCDSVALEACMVLEEHEGLVHLASRLSGRLRAEATPADLVRACFPAGTVGGVPRAPAGALIEQLEPEPRGWYAGAVGALLPGGDLQLWLTIRSLRLQGAVATVRTGAGLVPESDPEAEWAECRNKARRALAAVGAELDAESGAEVAADGGT